MIETVKQAIGRRPDLILYFYRPGYKQLKHIFIRASDNDTLYLEKLLSNQYINNTINK
jgi:hypothetical protein